MPIREYFDAEMRLLQEAASAFFKAYPDRDPYVERLLEGVAYLTAQTRERIEDELPDITATFLQQLCPQLLQPFPAVTLLEFSSPQKTFLPKGSMVVSDPKTACKFATTSDLRVNPIELLKFDLSDSKEGGMVFKFMFEFKKEEVDLKNFRLYLHGDPTIALELYWALTGNLKKINLPGVSVKGANFCENDTLLMPSDRSFQGFHVLQDYFNFREKYLFLEFDGLEKQTKSFELILHTHSVFPAEMRVTKDNFKLHCVPAINIYEQSSEPIRYDKNRWDYPLVPDNSFPESVVLQSINTVSYLQQNGERKMIEAFHEFKHLEKEVPCYQLVWRDSGKELPLHYLSIKGETIESNAVISCDITVSNGHIPRHSLREGMVRHVVESAQRLMVKNITRPTQFLLPPKRQYYLWELLGILSFNAKKLNDKNQLQKLLHLFDWTEKEENRKRIEAIQSLQSNPINKIQQGALMRGTEFILNMKEEDFRGLGELYLFGCVLHAFFKLASPLNEFVHTKIIAYPSQREFSW